MALKALEKFRLVTRDADILEVGYSGSAVLLDAAFQFMPRREYVVF